MGSHETSKERRRANWYDQYSFWQMAEPPVWRIFSWLSWRKREPKKPDWLIKYEERREETRWWV